MAPGADALILDLEDAVAPAAKAEARRHGRGLPQRQQPGAGSGCGSTRSTAPRPTRTSPRSCPRIPDGIVLPKAEGGASVAELARRLTERGNATAQILAIATETPAAMFQLGTYGGAKRLAGLTWGAEDLPAAIGAATSREEDGRYTPPYELARSLCLFGAAAAGVAPIETVYPAFRDLDGLAAYAGAGAARRLHRHDGDPSRPGAGDQRRLHAERGGDRPCPGGGRRVRGQSGGGRACRSTGG